VSELGTATLRHPGEPNSPTRIVQVRPQWRQASLACPDRRRSNLPADRSPSQCPHTGHHALLLLGLTRPRFRIDVSVLLALRSAAVVPPWPARFGHDARVVPTAREQERHDGVVPTIASSGDGRAVRATGVMGSGNASLLTVARDASNQRGLALIPINWLSIRRISKVLWEFSGTWLFRMACEALWPIVVARCLKARQTSIGGQAAQGIASRRLASIRTPPTSRLTLVRRVTATMRACKPWREALRHRPFRSRNPFADRGSTTSPAKPFASELAVQTKYPIAAGGMRRPLPYKRFGETSAMGGMRAPSECVDRKCRNAMRRSRAWARSLRRSASRMSSRNMLQMVAAPCSRDSRYCARAQAAISGTCSCSAIARTSASSRPHMAMQSCSVITWPRLSCGRLVKVSMPTACDIDRGQGHGRPARPCVDPAHQHSCGWRISWLPVCSQACRRMTAPSS
jgi:hypothetical protein